MSLLVPWLVFPIVMSLLSAGWGVLVECALGRQLPTGLLVPVGFASIVVAGEFLTLTSRTADLTTPAVAALAVAGIALRPARLRPRLYVSAAAIATFAAYGAPVLLTGRATFTGYIKLDDTSTWLALADQLISRGRDLSHLAPSTYEAVLNDNIPQGYPLGAFPGLGVGHVLTGTDGAWLFQPYLAFHMALLACSLYALTARIIRSSAARALTAFVAAQPALLYGYALWGGIKETLAAALLAGLAASLGPLTRQGASLRSALAPAVVTAALISTLSLGGSAWLVPLLIPMLAIVWKMRGARAALTASGVYVLLTLALSAPVITGSFSFADKATSSSELTNANVLGNLFHPLSVLQVIGIWPVGDFRVSPDHLEATRVLLGVVALSALFGIYRAWKARAWPLLTYAAGGLAACALIVSLASPWVDAKALAIAAPVILLLALVGPMTLIERGHLLAPIAAVAATVAGVAVSNVFAYNAVTLAPRDQLVELERIGRTFENQGPTLLNEYSPYGARHFLRNMDAESPSERRVRADALRNGRELGVGQTADVDEFPLQTVLTYRTLVLRRSGTASRPPSVYRLVWAGRYYDVWQRPDPAPATIVEHLPLGSRYDEAGVAPCATIARLMREAGRGGSLASVSRAPVTKIDLSATPYAASGGFEDRHVVYVRGPTNLGYTFRATHSGEYSLWLGGSFVGSLTLKIDGKRTGSWRHELNWANQYTPLATITLSSGPHTVALDFGGADWRAGSAANPPNGAGPLIVSRGDANAPVTNTPAAEGESLCGKRLDWVEAVR